MLDLGEILTEDEVQIQYTELVKPISQLATTEYILDFHVLLFSP